jgi:DNA (cytosine-5)-methyltransferase 1
VSALRADGGGGDPKHVVAHTLKGDGFDGGEDGTGRGTPLVPVSFDSTWSGDYGVHEDQVGSLRDGNGTVPAVATRMAVRRLTAEECEALQGFPRGYTAITYRGKPVADGNRYRALGNSMATPVVRWIGERMARVEAIA